MKRKFLIWSFMILFFSSCGCGVDNKAGGKNTSADETMPVKESEKGSENNKVAKKMFSYGMQCSGSTGSEYGITISFVNAEDVIITQESFSLGNSPDSYQRNIGHTFGRYKVEKDMVTIMADKKVSFSLVNKDTINFGSKEVDIEYTAKISECDGRMSFEQVENLLQEDNDNYNWVTRNYNGTYLSEQNEVKETIIITNFVEDIRIQYKSENKDELIALDIESKSFQGYKMSVQFPNDENVYRLTNYEDSLSCTGPDIQGVQMFYRKGKQ